MERRNNGGRPKAVERRSRHLNIRLTEAEYAKLRGTSGSLKISAYARRRLLGKTVSRSVPQINQLAWEELARTTANLNQLTLHANQGHFAHSEEFAQVLVRLSHTLKTVREGLIGGKHGHR
ncbi:plasmid mobilization protein [Donghicola tyrosinivorans]|uniref:plasmid mobilization protein n=1 Tax=Donghicola tyrosinivorans TaxID=1652492 RepID=UPI0011B25E79|nr:hypothetical protein [Donghicola tyrosinivorans]